MNNNHSILLVEPVYPSAWNAEPLWYKDAFSQRGFRVIPFRIPFRHTHEYASYPSANKVLRFRLNQLVKDEKPDVAFIIHGGGYWTKEMIWDLKNSGVTVIYYNPDEPMLFNSISRYLAPHADVVLAFPKMKAVYKTQLNIDIEEFFYCVDPAIITAKDSSPLIKCDILMTGMVDSSRKKTRGDMFYALHKAGIGDVRYYGPADKNDIGDLKQIHYGSIANNALHSKIIHGTKIIFNYCQELLPADSNSEYPDLFQSVSGRVFDGAAAKKIVLTNNFIDLDKAFDATAEVVIYKDIDDAIDTARFYLNNASEREMVSKNAELRALSDHTVEARIKTIENILVKSGVAS